MKFVGLAKSLREEGLANVYLVEGEESYFRDRAVDSIRAACNLMQPTLNDVRYEGETLKGDRLASFVGELRTLPFFDERRLVRVYDFYPTERDWTVLGPYCAAPCPTTVLLIVNTGGKKGVDLKRKKELVYVDCGREEPEALCRWLIGLCKRAGLSIDVDAADLMVQYCNLDAARMSLEVKKLSEFLGDGRVTRAVVTEYVAKDIEYKIYKLTEAASAGNANAFSEMLTDLLTKGYDESAALAALCSHFRTLSELSGMRGTDAEIAEKLGMKVYPVRKQRETVSRLGAARVNELYLRLYELSAGMRSGVYGKAGALWAAVAKIFFG